MNALPPQNHIFVDYQNVGEVDVSLFSRKPASVTLLLGANQKKLDAAVVEVLLKNAAAVHLVRLESEGPNALDFILAYYLGRTVLSDPSGYFHIVSKDTGFDPLVAHLRSRRIQACRHRDFSTLADAMSGKAALETSEDPLSRILGWLRKSSAARPRKKQKLINAVMALCPRSTQSEANKWIEQLRDKNHLSFDEKDAVSYDLR